MKSVPFTAAEIESLIAQHPTPLYVYDEAGIRATARKLIEAFSWNEGFKEYFAVKALPNPRVLGILREEGCGADCSSLLELLLAERAGLSGEEIMFTSNDTPIEEFAKAKEMGALINLDALEHLDYLEKGVGLPDFLSVRYNPGPLREGNAIIGKPEEAKFGMTREQIFEAYRRAKEKGVRRFGLHTMVASNERNAEYFVETARMLFEIVRDVRRELGVTIELVNLGGGIGIPYRPDDTEANLSKISDGIRRLFDEYEMTGVRLAMECGRYITGPHGYLLTQVRHLKHTYREYAGVDATMANLMRPGMYGAYHHITVLGKENEAASKAYDIVGSLCENNDKFAINRKLPQLQEGDILVIHDAGAHGHAMGFNYNGKLRSAEFLLRPDRSFEMIRRAETVEDYLATLRL
ncbi:MAG: diaminopimelate decarboxylase [Candidatus Kaiserbacteria bacterium]|nr:MAG: diaminopimelate decarboxylase [Candidatus Kaiserbacteria bacterium]